MVWFSVLLFFWLFRWSFCSYNSFGICLNCQRNLDWLLPCFQLRHKQFDSMLVFSPIISSPFPSFKGSKVVSPQISKNLFNFNCKIHHLFNVCISSDSAQFADTWPQFSHEFTSYYLAYHNISCTLSLGSCLTTSGWCLCCLHQHLHTAESSKSSELPNLLMRNSTSWTIFSSSHITSKILLTFNSHTCVVIANHSARLFTFS